MGWQKNNYLGVNKGRLKKLDKILKYDILNHSNTPAILLSNYTKYFMIGFYVIH